jgi:hypothetical protein
MLERRLTSCSSRAPSALLHRGLLQAAAVASSLIADTSRHAGRPMPSRVGCQL